MKRYRDLAKYEIDLICDYLRNPTDGKDGREIAKKIDYKRRKKLYEIGFHQKTKKNEKNEKFLTGALGEAIISLYYEKLNLTYINKPGKQNYNDPDLNKKVGLIPDGQLICGSRKFWVESKMRAYYSDGTANEKIKGVPQKYAPLGNKLILFLMADDEHKYNVRWSKLRRKEIKPMSKSEEYHLLGDFLVIEAIIYGTEVAEVLEKEKL